MSVVHIAADDDAVFLLAVTISSDGLIRVFNLTPVTSHDEALDLEPIAQYDTKHSRLTCLSAVGFNPDASLADAEDEAEGNLEGPASDMENFEEDDDNELDDEEIDAENSDEELARLEEEVRQAREAGVVIDEDGGVVIPDEDEDEDDEEGEEDEDDDDEEENEEGDEEDGDDDEGDDDDEEEEEEEEEAEEA